MMTKKEMQSFIIDLKMDVIVSKKKEQLNKVKELIRQSNDYTIIVNAIDVALEYYDKLVKTIDYKTYGCIEDSWPSFKRDLIRHSNDMIGSLITCLDFDNPSKEETKQFDAILGNIKSMSPTKAETYLQSLGFILPDSKPKKLEMLAPVNIKSIQQYINK